MEIHTGMILVIYPNTAMRNKGQRSNAAVTVHLISPGKEQRCKILDIWWPSWSCDQGNLLLPLVPLSMFNLALIDQAVPEKIRVKMVDGRTDAGS